MAVLEKAINIPPSAAARSSQVSTSSVRLGVGLALTGWAALTGMWATGSAGLFGHDQESVPAILGISLFLVGWTVMVAAMMLPSSLGTLRLVDQTPIAEPKRRSRFMVGYFVAWGAFGLAAFVGDAILHLSVAAMPWLAERPSLIMGGVAMLGGVTELAGRPSPPRFPAIRPGSGSIAIGSAHALDRIRRCWPLMLFALAVGMSSPAWMIALTLLMTLELTPRAEIVLRLAGLALFALGAAVVIEPSWLPVFFVAH